MTVTGALGLPSARSPSGPGCINSCGAGTLSTLSLAASAVGPTPPPQPESATPRAIRRTIVGPRIGRPSGSLLRRRGWGRPLGLGFVRIGGSLGGGRPFGLALIRLGRRGSFAQRDVEIFELVIALQSLAVDEEGRRRVDLKLFVGDLAGLHDLAE